VSRRQAVDENGSIEYACIKSAVGNVVHTILDASHYSGLYLPGFSPVTVPARQQQQLTHSIIRGIDHIAFAVPHGLAQPTMAWYERVLDLTRFVINR
jgi:4-hydroxyphenylpyruvate dioxygenase-like putative hemolysin